MMRALLPLIRRDIGAAWSGGGLWLPVIFLILVASLYPFAVGPDAAVLARTGGGMIWIAALLACLLSLDRLFQADAEDGTLDLLVRLPPEREGAFGARFPQAERVGGNP